MSAANADGKVARSLIWSAVENVGLAFISLACLVIYARVLTPADFGLFASALAIIELANIWVTMLFHDALVQRAEVTDAHFDSAFSVALLLSLLGVALCWGLGPYFSQWVKASDGGSTLRWMSLSLVAAAASSSITARERRELRFRGLALRSLIGRLGGAAAGIALAVWVGGVWGLVVQQIVMAAIGSLVLWLTCAKLPRLRLSWPHVRELLPFGAAAMGAMFLSFSVKRVYTVMAGALLGPSLAGVLNIAFRTVDVFWSIMATAVTQVAFPMLAGIRGNPAQFQASYLRASRLACTVLYLLFTGIAVLAGDIIRWLFGAQWQAAAPWVVCLAALVLLQAPRLLVTPAIKAVGRPVLTVLVSAVELLVVVAVLGWAGQASLLHVILAWMLRELIGAPLSLWLLRKTTSIPMSSFVQPILVPLLATSALVLCGAGASLLPLAGWRAQAATFAGLAVGSVLYGLIIRQGARQSHDDIVSLVWRVLGRPKSVEAKP